MLIANTDDRGQAADRPVRRRPGARRGGPPRRRPRRVPPAATGRGARRGSACPRTPHVLLFAGRIQPLKAPDVLLRAVAALLEREPGAARRGWSSRSSAGRPAPGSSTPRRWPTWPPSSGSPTSSGSCRRCRRPSWPAGTPRRRVVAVPSYNESFGLVAARGPGRRHPGRRRRGRRPDHGRPRRAQRAAGRRATSPADWAARVERLLDDRDLRAAAGAAARCEQARRVLAGSAPPSGRSTSTGRRAADARRALAAARP